MGMEKKRHYLAMGMLLIVTLIWGSGFIATEMAIRSGLSAAWIMMIRFLVGALLISLLFFRRLRPLKRRTLLRGILAGILLFGAFLTQTLGQSRTTVSSSALITATNVVMIPFLLWIVTRKRPALATFLLSLMTMTGVLLLTLQGDFRFRFGTGEALVLACALLFAAHIVWLDLGCSQEPPVQIAVIQLLTAGCLGALMVLLQNEPLPVGPLRQGFLPVLYLGLFSTGVCYFLQTWAQNVVRASEAGIILSCEGMFGTIFSLLLGLEAFRPAMLVGGILITASVMLAEVFQAAHTLPDPAARDTRS